ncbi:MAG: tRNA pseudouridine(55) synthase TruB [Desulfosudaceae bacterium]
MNGIVVLDKPADISSARLVGRIKRLFQAGKVGHAGTLDPFATGLMICLLNRATRLAGFFLHDDKTYLATLRLGQETDTLDATGTITATHDLEAGRLSENEIARICRSFEGESWQVPPAYSAVKHQGIPLYKLARKGVTVEKPPRRIMISKIDVKSVCLPEVTIEVACSGGTYIRTLGADIGRELGCGAHLTALRRTESSGFTMAEAWTPADLENMAAGDTLSDSLIPMNRSLRRMPAYPADRTLAAKIRNGLRIDLKTLGPPPPTDRQGHFQVIDDNGDLIAVMEIKEESLGYCCVFPD